MPPSAPSDRNSAGADERGLRGRGTQRIGFLGPEGTFTEQALLTQHDLAGGDLRPIESIYDVLAAVESSELDRGFVPLENSIEGTVNVTLDTLAFETGLLIHREVVISVQLSLLGQAGASPEDIKKVFSFPVAAAQCRSFLAREVPQAVVEAANSTADAARLVGETGDATLAAIAPHLAGEVYGLEILRDEIEDHPENATRFVVVARDGIPAPTGHDKTTIVVFQTADAPGSLLAILQEFAARAINLTKLESRPTKKGLGDYCFIIDLEGHVDEELVFDCLRDLQSKHEVKFLGSYPAAGEHGPEVRREAEVAWRNANEWVDSLRAQVER